jgi:hypothetical protein
MKRFVQLLLRVGIGTAISLACVLFVLRFVDLGQVIEMLSRAALPLLALAGAATMLDVLLRAWRWQVLVSPLTAVPIRRVLAYLLIGYLANNVLPARAGELVRSHYMGDRESASRLSILGTVLVERILDVVALLLLSAVAWWITGAAAGIAGLLAVGLMVGVVAGSGFAVMLLPAKQRLLPLLSPNLSARITLVGTRLKAGVAVVAAPGPLSVSIALTLSAWAMTAVVFAAAAAAVGFEVTPAQVLLIAAATNLATAIPSAPGYVGTFEFAVVATAGAIGLDAASALAMGILVHATILATTTVGGFAAFYVVTNGGRVAFSRPRRPAR